MEVFFGSKFIHIVHITWTRFLVQSKFFNEGKYFISEPLDVTKIRMYKVWRRFLEASKILYKIVPPKWRNLKKKRRKNGVFVFSQEIFARKHYIFCYCWIFSRAKFFSELFCFACTENRTFAIFQLPLRMKHFRSSGQYLGDPSNYLKMKIPHSKGILPTPVFDTFRLLDHKYMIN